jgi:3-oxoacyl-[acyl-carrier protein] reductase
MAGEFEGKIVVISGASRGIGRGIALAFARAGAQTVLASSS